MSSKICRSGAAILSAFALTSCSRDPSIFSPRGPAARAIGNLGAVTLVAFVVIAMFMTALIVWAAVRRKGSLDEHESPNVGGGQIWIFIGGFLFPAIVLCITFVASLLTLNRFPLHEDDHARPDIVLTGRQWWWKVQYVGSTPARGVITANEIHVPVGWPVEVELQSRDVIHSFWVPALHGKVDLVPGRTNHVRILADQPGRYQGECAEYCGAEHALMKFAVIAQTLDEYEKWLAHESGPAAAPSDPEAEVGKKLFETHACALCHTIRGTMAAADVGPDLTHIADRDGLAADSFPNQRAYLEAWIGHAQSLKPGANMPDLTVFSGSELRALAHYLEGLK